MDAQKWRRRLGREEGRAKDEEGRRQAVAGGKWREEVWMDDWGRQEGHGRRGGRGEEMRKRGGGGWRGGGKDK